MIQLTHLQKLEAEAIHIIREVAATCENPVLLYSIGKDSAVLLHLVMKAFAPGKPPFPLLHVDTTWKFQEMIAFAMRALRNSASNFSCTSMKRAVRRASIRSTRARACIQTS